eukprot:GILI01002225.1.p1 GENE.GILI01002225.1~~GILI01002225.1.p1  ORF type:complete len:456 (+),score=84.54 GILI01002225.1:159-1526(+)
MSKMGSTQHSNWTTSSRSRSPSGPLLSSLSRFPTSPSVSLKGRGPDVLVRRNDVPGPGAYSPETSKEFSTSPKFGTGPRSELGRATEVPGPDAYKPHDPAQISVAFKFGTGPRSDMSLSTSSPGPGAYTLGSTISQGPKVSITARRPDTSPSKAHIPGPGAYNFDVNGKVPAPKIGTGQRSSLGVATAAPGPGAYSPEAVRLDAPPKFSFGTSGRAGLASNTVSPGPASYRLPSSLEGSPKISMGARRPSTSPTAVPGPGAYNATVQAVADHSPTWKFGSSPQRSLLLSSSYTPGPGSYTLGSSLARKGSNRFGTSARPGMAMPTPSPGPAYDIPSFIPDGPKHYITPRRKDISPQKSSFTPGPGAYVPGSLEKAPAIRFGTSNRTSMAMNTASPGPGAYNSHVGKPETPMFSMAPRRDMGKSFNTPGPGAYDAPTSFGGPTASPNSSQYLSYTR